MGQVKRQAGDEVGQILSHSWHNQMSSLITIVELHQWLVLNFYQKVWNLCNECRLKCQHEIVFNSGLISFQSVTWKISHTQKVLFDPETCCLHQTKNHVNLNLHHRDQVMKNSNSEKNRGAHFKSYSQQFSGVCGGRDDWCLSLVFNHTASPTPVKCHWETKIWISCSFQTLPH